MGVKERRTKILLLLFLIAGVDFLEVMIDEQLQKIFDLTLNQKTRGTLSGLIKEGLIQKGATENTYKLTLKGFEELSLKFPLFRYLKNTWDGKWRIISYEIPEKKREIRDRLRLYRN